MKRSHIFILCFFIVVIIPFKISSAEDVFPGFRVSHIKIYVPISAIPWPQDDIEHEVGFNFSYTINGQLFTEPGQGYIQTRVEGFSGTSDKSTPWKTLTELLSAIQSTDIEAIKALYTPDSADFFNEIFSHPTLKAQYIDQIQEIIGMDVLIGFEHQ